MVPKLKAAATFGAVAAVAWPVVSVAAAIFETYFSKLVGPSAISFLLAVLMVPGHMLAPLTGLGPGDNIWIFVTLAAAAIGFYSVQDPKPPAP